MTQFSESVLDEARDLAAMGDVEKALASRINPYAFAQVDKAFYKRLINLRDQKAKDKPASVRVSEPPAKATNKRKRFDDEEPRKDSSKKKRNGRKKEEPVVRLKGADRAAFIEAVQEAATPATPAEEPAPEPEVKEEVPAVSPVEQAAFQMGVMLNVEAAARRLAGRMYALAGPSIKAKEEAEMQRKLEEERLAAREAYRSRLEFEIQDGLVELYRIYETILKSWAEIKKHRLADAVLSRLNGPVFQEEEDLFYRLLREDMDAYFGEAIDLAKAGVTASLAVYRGEGFETSPIWMGNLWKKAKAAARTVTDRKEEPQDLRNFGKVTVQFSLKPFDEAFWGQFGVSYEPPTSSGGA